MNTDVTVRTVLILRTGHIMCSRQRLNSIPFAAEWRRAVVTLQAHCEYQGPPKKAGISRTVRRMAHFASLDANRRMLKGKRTALIGMTLQTRLFSR